MKTRLKSGTCDILNGTRVCSGNYWERDGRLTAKVALPEQTLILGVGDEFLVGETKYLIKAIEEESDGDYLVIEGLGEKKVPIVKKKTPPVIARMMESDFEAEDKVTLIFQSGSYELGGVQMGLSSFGIREKRLSARLVAGKHTKTVYENDDFDIGIFRFKLLKIQRTESGYCYEAFLKKIGPADDPVDLQAISREKVEAKNRRQEWKKMYEEHTFEIPRKSYLEVLEGMETITPELLRKLSSDETIFKVGGWESEMKSDMHRNLKEGDMGPNTIETKQALLSSSDAQASTTVSITRWNPDSVANMSASAGWSVGGERITCSLHCSADGEVYQAFVMGSSSAMTFVKKFLLRLS